MAAIAAHSPATLGRLKRQAAKRSHRGPRSLTPRVKAAIHALVWGDATSIQAAAAAANLTDRALREAFVKPEVRQHYQQQIEVLRNGGKSRAIKLGMELMDAPSLVKGGASSQKVRLEAAKFVSGEDSAGVQVNVGVTVQNMPGYRVDVPYDPAAIARAMARAGSVAGIGPDVIDSQLPQQAAGEAKPLIERSGVPHHSSERKG